MKNPVPARNSECARRGGYAEPDGGPHFLLAAAPRECARVVRRVMAEAAAV